MTSEPSDRFDDAKRALDDVPARDVWAEAERRAADGTVVPLAPVPARAPRHRARWLAAAAALVLAAGTVAVLAQDGDDPVDTVPGGSDSGPASETEITTYQAPGGCKVGIAGAPLPAPTRVSAVVITEESHATLIEGNLNPGQFFAVQVPGQVVTDLVGERVEEVQLRRGTAALWFQGEQVVAPDGRLARNPVQLRWFTGSEEPCESFTVTVDGGTEDENRHAAVDLGERVLMSTELPGCCEEDPAPAADPLDGTGWQLERATVDGEPTGGSGALFSFAGGRVTWSDLCNTFEGGYEVAEGMLLVDPATDVTGSGVSCTSNPTTDAISADELAPDRLGDRRPRLPHPQRRRRRARAPHAGRRERTRRPLGRRQRAVRDLADDGTGESARLRARGHRHRAGRCAGVRRARPRVVGCRHRRRRADRGREQRQRLPGDQRAHRR